MRRTRALLMALPLVLSFPTVALAQIITAPIFVVANIPTNASLITGGLIFSTIADPATEIATAQTSIEVAVAPGQPYEIIIDAGMGFASGTRNLNCPLPLPYEVYQDAALTIVWGDNGTTHPGTGTRSGEEAPQPPGTSI